MMLHHMLISSKHGSLPESASLLCARGTRHGKGSFAHDVCCTRQIGVGKEVLCRAPFIRHMAKSLPSAKKHSAKIFSEN